MDAYDPRKKTQDKSIFFEKAAMMFNMAACFSYEGVTQNRTTAEGCKNAVRLLQQAAGWFEALRKSVYALVSRLNCLPVLLQLPAQGAAGHTDSRP